MNADTPFDESSRSRSRFERERGSHRDAGTPFDSIESTHEYMSMFLKSIDEARRDVAAEIAGAEHNHKERLKEALLLVAHGLAKLNLHISSTSRILNDLRMLRRLLLGEQQWLGMSEAIAPRAPDIRDEPGYENSGPGTSFNSIAGSHEYISLVAEVIEEARRDLEAEVFVAERAGNDRAKQALDRVSYNLAKLGLHIVSSRRIINDLRSLGRLLLAEREPREGDIIRYSDATDFTVTFDPELSEEQIKATLTALADFYRVCGGVGLEVRPETEEVSVQVLLDA
jgi:hypothetical protein